ncbi:MAG: hydrogenase maturation protease [Anaerolineae bacterium]|jgi:hydrogenase maturation protease|nr:hydrogenase maturation protease [Anaerolineae bacterium]MBT7324891.1 hydrogenase maturation protease [Anaerolineae bacterium]
MTKTLIIGLGNPILGDDGIGWAAADALKEKGVRGEIIRLSLGGLSLMEHISGYERVILIDAIQTGQHPIGTVRVFPLTDLRNPFSGHSASAHDTSLLTALDTGRRLDIPLPTNKNITIVAIEAENVYDFSEDLSPFIAAAVPVTVEKVLTLL